MLGGVLVSVVEIFSGSWLQPNAIFHTSSNVVSLANVSERFVERNTWMTLVERFESFLNGCPVITLFRERA